MSAGEKMLKVQDELKKAHVYEVGEETKKKAKENDGGTKYVDGEGKESGGIQPNPITKG